MDDCRLLQSQKNEVVSTIIAAGLDPLVFRFEEQKAKEERGFVGPIVTIFFNRLVHIPSKYGLLFGEDIVVYRPGAEAIEEVEKRLNWTGKVEAVERWLTYLKREINEPDLWASLAQERELLASEPMGAVNAPFNAEEQSQIRRAIDEIRVYITSTYSLASEPLAKVNGKLDYLIDASTRIGRIDWKNIFVGALVGLVLQQLIPGSGFQDLIGVASHLLRRVLGGVISSPPLLH